MKRILKKMSGVILVLVSVAIWCIYSYEQSNSSILTSSNIISRKQNRLGSKKRKKS